MFKKRLIRVTCAALVLTILPLAMLFTAGSYLGWFSGAGILSPDNFDYKPMKWDRDKIDLAERELELKINDLIDAIDQLPELDQLKLSDKPAILDALSKFAQLPVAEQHRVHNYDKLEEALEQIEKMENAAQETDPPPDTDPGVPPETETEPEAENGGEMAGDKPTGVTLFQLYSSVSGDLYLKETSYGSFRGQGWGNATPYRSLLEDKYSAEYLPWMMAYSDQQIEKIRVTSLGYDIRVNPYSLAHGSGALHQTSDVQAIGGASKIYTMYFVQGTGTPTGNPDAATKEFESAYRDFVYDNYLELDLSTKVYMDALIAKQGFQASDPAIIQKVADYIRGAATYNMDYDPTMDEQSNVAIAFLEHYREGVCRHYATAATLLYRSLGIPARYTVGYLAAAEEDTIVNVTDERGHAWVEVYIDGIGWQPVEVTGTVYEDESDPPVEHPEVKDLVFQVPSESVVYDGQPHGHSRTVSASGFEELAELGYTYECELSPVEHRHMPGTETVEITRVTIYDPSGRDVTNAFKYKTTSGSFQIYIATLILESDDITLFYNGKYQTGAADRYRINYALSAAATGITEAELHEHIAECGVVSMWTAGTSYRDIGSYSATMSVQAFGRDSQNCADYFIIPDDSAHRYGTFTILPRPELSITVPSQYTLYDGQMHSYDQQVSYEGFERLDAYGYTYSWELVGDESRATPGITEVKVAELVIRDPQGRDVTDAFTVRTTPGKFRIYIAKLLLESDDITLYYNGLFQSGTADQYRINYEASAAATGITEAELHEHIAECGVVNLAAIGETYQRIGNYKATMSLKATLANGVSCEDYFLPEYDCGGLSILPQPEHPIVNGLSVTAPSQYTLYDGQVHSYNQSVVYEGFEQLDAYGYTYSCELSYVPSRATPGKTEVNIVNLVILAPDGRDVTSVYTVEKNKGEFRIYLANLVLESDDITRVYNGTEQVGSPEQYRVNLAASAEASGLTVAELNARLAEFGVAKLEAIGKAYREIGSHTADMSLQATLTNGNNGNHYFHVSEYRCGTFTIVPHNVEGLAITAPTVEILYDGQVHSYGGTPIFTGFEQLDALGYTYTCELTAVPARATPGITTVYVTNLVIRDAAGGDATNAFEVTKYVGNFQIYIAKLVLESDDINLVYNGQFQSGTADQYRINYVASARENNITVDELMARFAEHGNIKAWVEGTKLLDIGNHIASMELCAQKESGQGCADYFLISRQDRGSLKITPATLVLVANSATEEYDFANPDYVLTDSGWYYGYLDANGEGNADGGVTQTFAMPGDKVEVTVEGSKSGVGWSANTITNVVITKTDILVNDQKNYNVTRNYHIILVDGRLTLLYPRS